jgi:DNA-binding transcriptional MocR family regulator
MTVAIRYGISGRTARAVAGSVEKRLVEGRLAPGDPLPTVRSLAASLGVSPATVASAYRSLRLRGLVIPRGRRGTRVAPRPPVAGGAADVVPGHLRNLADGNPDGALLPSLRAALRQLPERPRLYGERTHRPELLEIAGRQLRADGVAAGPVAVVGGALDGIERVLQAHLRPGDRVAVEDPGHTGVLDLVGALGLVARPVGLDDFGPLPEEMRRALELGIEAVIVTPRAQNPTGAALDGRRARDLRRLLDRHPDALVIEDDHAGPIAGAPAWTLTRGRVRWALVRSVCKSLGPDLRLAVLAGDPSTIARVEGRQVLGTGWVSHVLQGLVVALWSDPRTEAAVARAAAAYARRRRALIDALSARGVAARGRSGLNVWVPVAKEARAVTLLAEAGWAVRAGEPYRRHSPPAIRVTIATLEPGEALRLAADIARCLRADRPGRSASA